MKVWQSLIVLVCLLCLGQANFAHAALEEWLVLYTIVAGDNQSGVPGTTLPVRFSVRVTNWAGEPYVGARVLFEQAEGPDCDPLLGCQDDSNNYGTFVSDPYHVYTDSNGVATAPPWRMGSYPSVHLWAYATYGESPHFFDPEQVWTHAVRFTVQSTAAGVPVNSPAMLGSLGLSLALMAGWLLRRRVGG